MKPSEGKTKYGLWEDGKLIQWFNQDSVKEINSLRQDYTQLFTNDNSSTYLPD